MLPIEAAQGCLVSFCFYHNTLLNFLKITWVYTLLKPLAIDKKKVRIFGLKKPKQNKKNSCRIFGSDGVKSIYFYAKKYVFFYGRIKNILPLMR